MCQNQNPKYEIIGAPAKNWHNTAADIAKTVDEQYRHIIWRDLQFQHIYDLGQKFLIQSRKKKILYLAILLVFHLVLHHHRLIKVNKSNRMLA